MILRVKGLLDAALKGLERSSVASGLFGLLSFDIMRLDDLEVKMDRLDWCFPRGIVLLDESF